MKAIPLVFCEVKLAVNEIKFPKLKMQLKGLRFDTISEIQKIWTEALKTITKEEYQRCFQKLYDRSKDFISSKGMYFE